SAPMPTATSSLPDTSPGASSGAARVQAARPWPLPLLANVPFAQQDYVVFDVETTGTDAQVDRILQIAAIKVIGGAAVEWFNCYVNPGDREISDALRFVLGIDRDPSIEQSIRAAESIDQVLPRFLDFGAGLPLVAHNARFDGAMLLAALGEAQLPVPLI